MRNHQFSKYLVLSLIALPCLREAARAELDPKDKEALVESVSSELQKSGAIEVNKKNYYWYHYVARAKIRGQDEKQGIVATPDSPLVDKQFVGGADDYWNETRRRLGGLNTATNPYVSRCIAESNEFYLERIGTPPGARSIRLEKLKGITLSKETSARLKKIGCNYGNTFLDLINPYGFGTSSQTRKYEKAPVNIHLENCLPILKDVYKKLDIAFLDNFWVNSKLQGCDSTSRVGIFFNLEPFKQDRVTFHEGSGKVKGTPAVEREKSAIRAMIMELSNQRMGCDGDKKIADFPVWNNEDVKPLTGADYIKWKAEHVPGCEKLKLPSSEEPVVGKTCKIDDKDCIPSTSAIDLGVSVKAVTDKINLTAKEEPAPGQDGKKKDDKDDKAKLQVTVRSATLAGMDITKYANDFCLTQGKACEYFVAWKHLKGVVDPDPTEKNKEFRITYTCGGATEEKSLVRQNALNQKVNMVCK